MENLDVRILSLPPMRVASFYAYSEYPEKEALTNLISWAREHSYWEPANATRIFGFDNPSTSVGTPNRGYEFWMAIGSEVQEDDTIKIKEFPGGLFAVLRCEVKGDPFASIPPAWQKLVRWVESSHYHIGGHQCLEEHLSRTEPSDDNFILDLYLPIVE